MRDERVDYDPPILPNVRSLLCNCKDDDILGADLFPRNLIMGVRAWPAALRKAVALIVAHPQPQLLKNG